MDGGGGGGKVHVVVEGRSRLLLISICLAETEFSAISLPESHAILRPCNGQMCLRTASDKGCHKERSVSH